MQKIRIKLITLGYIPPHVNFNRITSWKSKVFEIVSSIENYEIRCNSDGSQWEFSDLLLRQQIKSDPNVDFIFALTNVPLQNNWYSRRIEGNRTALTFHEIKDYLKQENIPLENVVLRVLYAYTLLFIRSDNRIPTCTEDTRFTHDETRGCLYDMNGVKSDIIESCVASIICNECQETMRNQRVSNETISFVQSEIKKIRKTKYFQVLDFIKQKPILALIISSIFALIIGIVGSILASFIYDAIKNMFSI
jgi:hypothetical protein